MPGESDNTGLAVLYLLIAIPVIALAAGVWMRRRGKLRSRAAALAWTAIIIVPLLLGLVLYGEASF